MRAAERGKIGLGALVVCAAVGYVAWKWGVPWVERTTWTREEPPKAAPPAPAAALAPAPTPASEPAPPDPGTAPTPSATPSEPSPVDPREAAARKLLNEAKNWEANERWETAVAKYEELIEVYQGTQVAEEAKLRLKALQSK